MGLISVNREGRWKERHNKQLTLIPDSGKGVGYPVALRSDNAATLERKQ